MHVISICINRMLEEGLTEMLSRSQRTSSAEKPTNAKQDMETDKERGRELLETISERQNRLAQNEDFG